VSESKFNEPLALKLFNFIQFIICCDYFLTGCNKSHNATSTHNTLRYNRLFYNHNTVTFAPARFLIRFPDMKAILPQPIPHTPSGVSPVKLSVLVVDDEPAVLFAYSKLIERSGMSVDICANLEDAIRQIRAKQYLAVIADMRLEGSDNMDGLEVLRIVQKERPLTKTILATGYGDSEIEKQASDLGASYYFKKPVNPSDILRALREFNANTPEKTNAVPS